MQRSFEPEDFEQMTFPIYEMPKSQSVLKTFPRLGKVPVFKMTLPKGLNRDMVMRYIIYLYDPGCPFQIVDDQDGERTLLALEYAGFNLKVDDLSEEVKNMVNGNVGEINEMIITFWRTLRDPLYTHLKAMERIYYGVMRDVQRGKNIKSTDVKQARDAFIEAQNEFMAGENRAPMIQKVYELINREVLEISPESVAKSKMKGSILFADVDASSGQE